MEINSLDKQAGNSYLKHSDEPRQSLIRTQGLSGVRRCLKVVVGWLGEAYTLADNDGSGGVRVW